jgi:hypothetical protein
MTRTGAVAFQRLLAAAKPALVSSIYQLSENLTGVF